MPRRHAGWGAICVYSRYSPFSHRGPGAPVKRTLFFPNLLLITFAISGTVGPCAKQPTSTLREAADLHQLREAGKNRKQYRYCGAGRLLACLLTCLLASLR